MTETKENENLVPDTPATESGFGLGALVTTGVVATIAGFSASLLYFHFFPQVVKVPAPIAVVDTVKLGLSIADLDKRLGGHGDSQAFMNAGHAINMLKEYGYIVLDSRMVIAAPDEFIRKPSQLVKDARDDVTLGGDLVNESYGNLNY